MKDKGWINTRVIQNEAHCKALLFMVSPSNYCQLRVHYNCLLIGLVLDLTQVLLVEIQQFFVWLHCCTVYFVRWMFQNISIFPILKTTTSYIELHKKERAGIVFLQDWSTAMSLVTIRCAWFLVCLIRERLTCLQACPFTERRRIEDTKNIFGLSCRQKSGNLWQIKVELTKHRESSPQKSCYQYFNVFF